MKDQGLYKCGQRVEVATRSLGVTTWRKGIVKDDDGSGYVVGDYAGETWRRSPRLSWGRTVDLVRPAEGANDPA